MDWNMRIVTPLEPLSHLGVILDLADGEVPGEPSIVERAGSFVAVSVTQSSALDFRPLVVASAALLAAWAQVGDLTACGRHLRTLVQVSGAHDEDELLRCKTLLNAGFNQKTCHRDEMRLVSHLHLQHKVAPAEPWEWEARRQVAPDTSLFSACGGRSPAY